jgi:hypothetical protein
MHISESSTTPTTHQQNSTCGPLHSSQAQVAQPLPSLQYQAFYQDLEQTQHLALLVQATTSGQA